MIVAIPIDTFNKQYVLFLKPTKNKLMENATFTKIIYSPPNIMLNGIYLYIKHIPVESIVEVERTLLSSYTSDKTPSYGIQKSVQKHSSIHVLKISGIWENEKFYGLAYKIIHETHLF
jgi:hypothetical protein